MVLIPQFRFRFERTRAVRNAKFPSVNIQIRSAKQGIAIVPPLPPEKVKTI